MSSSGPSRSETPDSPGPKTLVAELQAVHFEWGENQWIIPNSSLDALLTYSNVSAELRRISSSSLDNEKLKYYTSEICRARRKLFAILVYGWGESSESGRCCKTVLDLVHEGVTDADLPFDRNKSTGIVRGNDRNGNTFKLCFQGHAECKSSDHRCLVEALEHWPKKGIIDFSRLQWTVLAPVLEKTGDEIPHFDLDRRMLLPFREDHETDNPIHGGYSEVWRVRICAGHQNFYHSPDPLEEEPLLAVKRLFSTKEDDFTNETQMLKALTNEKHKNLVKLLATYKYKGRYHLLFPYAEANLRSLWDSFPNPQRNVKTYRWALDQMTGLSSGLVAIHSYKSNMAYKQELGNPGLTRFRLSATMNIVIATKEEKFGRHGDLKPENILWFNDSNGPQNSNGVGPYGILQITDFGLGRFHRLESRSMVDPKKVAGSASYTPPEISLVQFVSRAYDIWSLGCVFLEFVTWLLEGSTGLERFTDVRIEKVSAEMEDDTFYSLVQGGAEVRGGVQKWIEHLKSSPRCSPMVYELLQLLKDELLVVESKSRIKAERLYIRLTEMLEKSRDQGYLIGNI